MAFQGPQVVVAQGQVALIFGRGRMGADELFLNRLRPAGRFLGLHRIGFRLEKTQIIVADGQIVQIVGLAGEPLHQLLLDADGFLIGLPRLCGLVDGTGQQAQIAVGEGQIALELVAVRIVGHQLLLNCQRLPVSLFGLGRFAGAAQQQAEIVVAEGQIGPTLGFLGVQGGPGLKGLRRLAIFGQRGGLVSELFGDGGRLGIGDGQIALKRRVVARILDEPAVVAQRIEEQLAAERFGTGRSFKRSA